MSWNLFAAAIVITVGVLCLFDSLRVIRWGASWPLLLIAIGGLLFARNGAPVDGHVQPVPPGLPPIPPPNSSTYSATSQANSSSEANHG